MCYWYHDFFSIFSGFVVGRGRCSDSSPSAPSTSVVDGEGAHLILLNEDPADDVTPEHPFLVVSSPDTHSSTAFNFLDSRPSSQSLASATGHTAESSRSVSLFIECNGFHLNVTSCVVEFRKVLCLCAWEGASLRGLLYSYITPSRSFLHSRLHDPADDRSVSPLQHHTPATKLFDWRCATGKPLG